jgi:hypothetical protein
VKRETSAGRVCPDHYHVATVGKNGHPLNSQTFVAYDQTTARKRALAFADDLIRCSEASGAKDRGVMITPCNSRICLDNL